MADPVTPNSKSQKYNNAVNKATGGNAESDAPQIVTSAAGMVRKATDDDIKAIVSDTTMEFAPQLLKLEEGDMLEGILEGNGPDAELERVDRATKQVTVNIVKTWIVRDTRGGQRASILGSAQLDRKLPPFVGGMVKIVRGKDIETSNGNRVTDYLVAGPRIEGQTRTWAVATKPVLDVGDAPAQGALPAASGNAVTH